MTRYEVLEVMLVGVAFSGLTASSSVQEKKDKFFTGVVKKQREESAA